MLIVLCRAEHDGRAASPALWCKSTKQVGNALHQAKRGRAQGWKGRHPKAKSRKQAIAIGLSEARRKGAKVPPRPHHALTEVKTMKAEESIGHVGICRSDRQRVGDPRRARRAAAHDQGAWYRLLRKPRRTPPDWDVRRGVARALQAHRLPSKVTRRVRASATAPAARARSLSGDSSSVSTQPGRHADLEGAISSRAALVDLGATIATVMAYMARVRSVDRPAAALMTPYLAWLGFASTLNGSIVRRTPALLAG